MTTDSPVRTGLERLCATPTLVTGRRLGLVTNHTGVLTDLTPGPGALLAAGCPLVALFGPEHGVGGTAQAGHAEAGGRDAATGLPVYDTYQRDGAELDAQLDDADVDTILCDLQDVGARFYTYVWTMYDVWLAAARTGRRFVVLDRPNPIGGARAEGPPLDPAYASFVGRVDVPMRHGLTIGELARQLRPLVTAQAGREAELAVVELDGWRRDAHAGDTGLVWVPPSPNIPTADTALAYAGTCLFEGTNLSEGRGTTRPFETVGAPYVDDRLLPALRRRALPGVLFRDLAYVPTFGKYAGESIRGVQLHVTDRSAFAPVRTALAMLAELRALYPDAFGWRTADAGIEGTTHRHFVDLLWGSPRLRETLDAGADPLALLEEAGLPEGAGPADWAGADTLLYD